MSGVEQTVHVKAFSASERALGADVRVDLGNLPKRIGQGHGHLAGFIIEAVLNTDRAATSDAVAGKEFLEIFGDMALTVAGIELFGPSVSGRDLRDDMAMRVGAAVDDPSAQAANQNVTGASNTVRLLFRFSDGHENHRRDGLIDLALLDHRKDPDSAIRFTLGSAIVGAPTGWTLNSISALNVYAITRYEPETVRAPLRVVEARTFTELSGTVTPAVPGAVTRLDYAIARPTPEETGGQDVSAWAGIARRQESRNFKTKDADILGAATRIDRQGRGVTADSDMAPGTGYLPLFVARPQPDANELISADVGWDIDSINNHGRVRVLTSQRVMWTDAMRASAARMGQSGRPEPVQTRSLPAGLLARRLR